MYKRNKWISTLMTILFLLITCKDGFPVIPPQLEGYGVWADSDLPIAYVIDTDSFNPSEADAIESAFNKWGSISGSKLHFVKENYSGQTLVPNPNYSPITPYVLVTKKALSDIPPYYQDLISSSGGSAAYPFPIASGRIELGCIIFRTKPVGNDEPFPDLYSWSTTSEPTWRNRDVESTALHEIGHLIGLGHPGPENDVPLADDAKTVLGTIPYGERVSLYPDDEAAARTLYPTPPLAISYSPTVPSAPVYINFDATGSLTNNGAATYFWDFGDGQTGNVKSETHFYRQSGNYNVQMTMTDADGPHVVTETVTVRQHPIYHDYPDGTEHFKVHF